MTRIALLALCFATPVFAQWERHQDKPLGHNGVARFYWIDLPDGRKQRVELPPNWKPGDPVPAPVVSSQRPKPKAKEF